MLLAVPVCAQVTLSPVAISGSDLESYDATTSFDNMINQSGLAEPFVSGSTDFNSYFATPGRTFASNGGTNNWQSNFSFELPFTGYVDFDLGAVYLVDKLAIWNVSVRDVTITAFQELNQPGQVVGRFTLTNHVNFPFSYPVDLLSFGADYPARYLRLAIESAYTFSASDTFAYAIIGEVVVSARPLGGPTLQIALTPQGDVILSYSGTLQSAAKAEGPFANVPGNPRDTFTVSKAALAEQQYFRVMGE